MLTVHASIVGKIGFNRQISQSPGLQLPSLDTTIAQCFEKLADFKYPFVLV